MNRAIFLDRDGVIIEELYYAYKQDQLNLIPKSADGIRLLNNNFLIVVVSNQAGVAHGYYTEKDVIIFTDLMKNKLREKGANIDAIYYCFHHPNAEVEKYRLDCDCRKPKPGMLNKAKKDLNIDLEQSFIIGDKKTDIDAGKSVGCKGILVLTGQGKEETREKIIDCDLIANDLFEATEYILNSNK